MAQSTSFAEVVHLGRETVNTRWQYIGENEAPLFSFFNKRSKQRLTEQGYRMPMQTRRPGGHTTYDAGNVNFRVPVSLETDSMRVYPIWYALPFQVQGPQLQDMKSNNADSFLSYKRYMESVTDAALKRLNYYMHGDGTGALAVCTSVITGTGSSTLNLQTLASSAAGEAETKGSRRLEVGHTYNIMNASTGAIKAVFTVTAWLSATSVTANTTTFNANTASGDPIVDGGPSVTTGAYKKAFDGLRSLCAQTGVLQNVPRSDYNELKTPRVNGGDNPVTPFIFRQMKDLVRIAANDVNEGSSKTTIMTPGMNGALCNQQFGYRRYAGNETVKGVAGKYVDEDGDMVVMDADAAEDRIYCIDASSYKLGEHRPFGTYDEDGNDIRMLVGANSTGSYAFGGAIGWGGNFIKDGLPRVDAYTDRLSQTDVAQQISL